MATIRDDILSFLQKNHYATSFELSRNIGITRADVQYHLQILVGQGLVDRIKGSLRGKGRPPYQYRLSPTGQPDNLPGMVSVLLDVLEKHDPLEAEQLIARNIFNSLNQIPSEIRVIYQLVESFNKLGYQARWEAHVNGPRIIFRNCPYKLLAKSHPILCRADNTAIGINLGKPYQQIAKNFQAGGSEKFCVFVVYVETR